MRSDCYVLPRWAEKDGFQLFGGKYHEIVGTERWAITRITLVIYLTRMQMGVAQHRLGDDLIGRTLEVTLVTPSAEARETRQDQRDEGRNEGLRGHGR